MAKDLIQFAGDPALIAWLDGRAKRSAQLASPGKRARTEILMWRDALTQEPRRQRWTLRELALLAEVHHGVIPMNAIATNIGMAAGGIIDGLHDDLATTDEKWDVYENALTKKLLDLGPTADHALIDAIARWWEAKAEHSVEGWASVGITVHDNGDPLPS